MTPSEQSACPWPHKIAYAGRAEALVAVKRGAGKRAYRCPAGHWHTTSRTKLAKRRRGQLAKLKDRR